MLLLWKTRYLDSCDKQFKDRNLYLETDSLDPVTKAAVEAIHDLQDSKGDRKMLRYRHLFHEEDFHVNDVKELSSRHDKFGTVFIHNYFEDEHGRELTNKQRGVILTGSPTAVMFPAGAKQHDIDYALADKRPIPIDQISLTQEQLNVLGYFARDLREMLASAFYKDGPGRLTSCGGSEPALETAVSDEEIRSFITIFRRLYMTGDPAGFLKAVAVSSNVMGGYPLGKWIKGIGDEYEAELAKAPHFAPLVRQKQLPFTCKRLIDVFLYTQYAHQPNASRIRQFQECLVALDHRKHLMTWLFLTNLWTCSLHMRNAGVIIADFYDQYRQYHKISCDVLPSIRSDNPGLGMLEKKDARQARVLREKAEELAMDIWKERGRLEGGPMQFINQAREQLKAAVTSKIDVRQEQS